MGFQRGDRVYHAVKGAGIIDSSEESLGAGRPKGQWVQFDNGVRTRHAITTLTSVSSVRKAKEMPTVDDAIAEAIERDLNREHARELKVLVTAEKRQRRLEETLRDCLEPYQATPLARVPDHRDDKPVHEDILILSDWHVGLRMTLEESGGLYEQTVATTRAQVQKLFNTVEHLHSIRSNGRVAAKLHIKFLGDLVEGDGMRASQSTKVECPVTQQVIAGFDMLAWLVRMALQIYAEVEVDMVGGNHDRTSPRPGDGGLGELSYVDNYTFLAGAFLERAMENDVATGRLKIRNWTTFFGYKLVSGLKVVFEHGSSFKWSVGSYGGVPWYAIANLGPKYKSMLGEADLILIGHGHRPALIPQGRGWILSNGALPATSTYIQAGQKVVSRPMQWLLSTHERHGITEFTPLYADVPEALMPGAVWDDPEHYASLASA